MNVALESTKVNISADGVDVSLDYSIINLGHIGVYLYDRIRNKVIEFMVRNTTSSLNKLENIVHYGISDRDFQIMSLISRIKIWRTQAKYFDRFASDELQLGALQRAVKLSTSKKFTLEFLHELEKIIPDTFILVCVFQERYDKTRIYYQRIKDHHIVVLMSRYGSNKFQRVLLFNELGVVSLNIEDKYNYSLHALYKYLTDDGTDLLKKWTVDSTHEDIDEVIRCMNEAESIFRRDVYDTLKTMLMMYRI